MRDEGNSLEQICLNRFAQEETVRRCRITTREHMAPQNSSGGENMLLWSEESPTKWSVLWYCRKWAARECCSLTGRDSLDVASLLYEIWPANHPLKTVCQLLSKICTSGDKGQEHNMTEAHIPSDPWHQNCLVLLDSYLTHSLSASPHTWEQSGHWNTKQTQVYLYHLSCTKPAKSQK